MEKEERKSLPYKRQVKLCQELICLEKKNSKEVKQSNGSFLLTPYYRL